MSDSNFAELRRVRTEMSAEAGHDARRFIQLLDGVRARYRDRLVNHGADAEQGDEAEHSEESVHHGVSLPVSQ